MDSLGYVWVDFELLGLKPKESSKGTKLALAGWWFVENTFQGVPILDAFKSPTLIKKKELPKNIYELSTLQYRDY